MPHILYIKSISSVKAAASVRQSAIDDVKTNQLERCILPLDDLPVPEFSKNALFIGTSVTGQALIASSGHALKVQMTEVPVSRLAYTCSGMRLFSQGTLFE